MNHGWVPCTLGPDPRLIAAARDVLDDVLHLGVLMDAVLLAMIEQCLASEPGGDRCFFVQAEGDRIQPPSTRLCQLGSKTLCAIFRNSTAVKFRTLAHNSHGGHPSRWK